MGVVKHIFFVTSLTLMIIDMLSDLEAGWQSIKLYTTRVNYSYTSKDCHNFTFLGGLSYEFKLFSLGYRQVEFPCTAFIKSINDKNLVFGILTLIFATIIPGFISGLHYLTDNSYNQRYIQFILHVLFFPVFCIGYTIAAYLKPCKYAKRGDRMQNIEIYFEAFPQLLLRMSMVMNDPHASLLGSFDIAFLTSGITFVFEPIIARFIDSLDAISFQRKVKFFFKIVFVYGLFELYYISIQVLV